MGGSADFGTSQSTDTEVLLSCPTIVPVSDEEVETENSDDDLDLSGDETVDSDDEAFVDPPAVQVRSTRAEILG